MFEFYKIIKSFELEEEEMDKLQIYLIHNCEKKEILLSALKRYETIEFKQRFLKSFIKSISSMLNKIFAITTICDTTVKIFFVLLVMTLSCLVTNFFPFGF
jgi:hypothetical protein